MVIDYIRKYNISKFIDKYGKKLRVQKHIRYIKEYMSKYEKKI
jgi:hypothetical protein